MHPGRLALLSQPRLLNALGREEGQRFWQRYFFRPTPSARNNPRQVNSIGDDSLIKLTVKFNGIRMKALLDLGAQLNYLSTSAMRRAGLTLQRCKQAYPLQVANGQLMPGEDQITHEVTRVPLQIHQHHEEIDLDVFEMATHDIILGLPWLRKHNPWIDWKNRCLSLK
jgi:hypothetical protein